MRKFTSYGPPDRDEHFYAPREHLIETICSQLRGDNPNKGGHYFTIWAPRQSGKTWVVREAYRKIKAEEHYEIASLNLESLRYSETGEEALRRFILELRGALGREFPIIKKWDDLPDIFTSQYFYKPFILLIDEFDSLANELIRAFVAMFR